MSKLNPTKRRYLVIRKRQALLMLFLVVALVIASGQANGFKKQKSYCDEIELESIYELNESAEGDGPVFLCGYLFAEPDLIVGFNMHVTCNSKLLRFIGKSSIPFLCTKRILSFHSLRLLDKAGMLC
ncbi:MAG: hypothetical protein GC180_05745 [Bacteroidetes bacterium]|nr:hypothetical protein [Bacteroidota bacterium]